MFKKKKKKRKKNCHHFFWSRLVLFFESSSQELNTQLYKPYGHLHVILCDYVCQSAAEKPLYSKFQAQASLCQLVQNNLEDSKLDQSELTAAVSNSLKKGVYSDISDLILNTKRTVHLHIWAFKAMFNLLVLITNSDLLPRSSQG